MMAATITLKGVAPTSTSTQAGRATNDSEGTGFADVLAGSVSQSGGDDQPQAEAQLAHANDSRTDGVKDDSHHVHSRHGKVGSAGKPAAAKHAQGQHDDEDSDDAAAIAGQTMAFIEGSVALTACTTPGGSISASSAATTSSAIGSAIGAVAAIARRTGEVASDPTARPVLSLVENKDDETQQSKEGWVDIVGAPASAATEGLTAAASLTKFADEALQSATHKEPHAHSTAVRAEASSDIATGQAGRDHVTQVGVDVPDAAQVAATQLPTKAAVDLTLAGQSAVPAVVDAASAVSGDTQSLNSLSSLGVLSPNDANGTAAATQSSATTGLAGEFAGQLSAQTTDGEHAKPEVQLLVGDSAKADATLASTAAATLTQTPNTAPVTAPQAPQPAATATPALPGDAAGQVANTLIAERKLVNGEHQLTINLHPADLGAVRVVAHVVDGQIRVELSAAHHVGHEALRAGMDDLDKSLKDHGFTSVDVSLSHSDDKGQGRAGSASSDAGERNRAFGRQDQSTNQGQADTPRTQTPVRSIYSQTSLDRLL